jgi:hypothetical protein
MTMSADDVRKYRTEQKKKRGKGGKRQWFSLKGGTVYIRVAAPWKKKGDFWKDVLFHGRYPNKVYCAQNDIDPKTGKRKKCAVCLRRAEIKSDKSAFAKALYGLLGQKIESLWNVFVAAKVKRIDEDHIVVRRWQDKTSKILRLAQKWHLELVKIFAMDKYRKKSVLGVADTKQGYTIKMTREGSGADDTEYEFEVVGGPTAIAKTKEERVALLKTREDLDALVTGSSKEELAAFVHRMEKLAKKKAGGKKSDDDDEVDDDDDEDEDEKVDADDDDDDDADDDDGDATERELDRLEKKKKKKGKKKKDDDDEEDEDADEEEDDGSEDEGEDEDEDDED